MAESIGFGVPPGWIWISLGLLMLVAEMLGAAGFLLGAAAAALLMGVANFVMPLPDWRIQVFVFGLLAIVFTLIYWKRFRTFNQASDQPQLNQKMQQLIGVEATIPERSDVAQERLKIGDTLWRVRSSQALTPGMRVRVIAVEGSVLVVEAVQ